MKIYTNDLVKGHSDFKVKCLTFGLYTQVSDSGPLGPLVTFFYNFKSLICHKHFTAPLKCFILSGNMSFCPYSLSVFKFGQKMSFGMQNSRGN